jgi:hypothetical protein
MMFTRNAQLYLSIPTPPLVSLDDSPVVVPGDIASLRDTGMSQRNDPLTIYTDKATGFM